MVREAALVRAPGFLGVGVELARPQVVGSSGVVVGAMVESFGT